MNSATRQTLRKKKQALAASRMSRLVPETDVSAVRAATLNKFTELLKDGPSTKENAAALAESIEKSLTKLHHPLSPGYRTVFRRLFVSLKNETYGFKDLLLEGKLAPEDFATKTPEELKSVKQREQDAKLKAEAIRNSVGQQLLPENVNHVKDGRDREKWGVARSAAAIDD